MIARHALVVVYSDLVDPGDDTAGAVLAPELVPGLRPAVPTCVCGWRGRSSRFDAVLRAQYLHHLRTASES